jgi:hypothetical protein
VAAVGCSHQLLAVWLFGSRSGTNTDDSLG